MSRYEVKAPETVFGVKTGQKHFHCIPLNWTMTILVIETGQTTLTPSKDKS